MNAKQLYLEDGKPSQVYFCSECKTVKRTFEEAEQCCQPYKCTVCGKEVPRYHNLCDCCQEQKFIKNELIKFEKSNKVKEWNNWVYLEDISGYNDGYFDSLDSFYEYCANESELTTEELLDIKFVWTCKEIPYVDGDINRVLESICDEDAPEGYDYEELNGIEELKQALNKFIDLNSGKVYYLPDYKTSVLTNWSNVLTKKSENWD